MNANKRKWLCCTPAAYSTRLMILRLFAFICVYLRTYKVFNFNVLFESGSDSELGTA